MQRKITNIWFKKKIYAQIWNKNVSCCARARIRDLPMWKAKKSARHLKEQLPPILRSRAHGPTELDSRKARAARTRTRKLLHPTRDSCPRASGFSSSSFTPLVCFFAPFLLLTAARAELSEPLWRADGKRSEGKREKGRGRRPLPPSVINIFKFDLQI